MISKRRREYNINFGSERIKISLSFQERKTLKISVCPDKTVTVDAPKGRKTDDILARVQKRAPWIIKQRESFERFQPLLTKRQYVSGESYYYLGRQYRLRVREDTKRNVKLNGKYIMVFTPDTKDTEEIKNLLQYWYRKRAEAIFSRRVGLFDKIIKRMEVILPKIQIRRMKRRWGSCSKKGAIILNTELVKAPSHCIDYVIMHELCHLKIRPHNNEFYKLIERHMPDWKLRKDRLEKILI